MRESEMMLELHWYENGRWHRARAREVAGFQAYGRSFSIHRALSNARRGWCVTDTASGVSIVINHPGTLREAHDAALDILAKKNTAHWAQLFARFDTRELH